MYFNEILSIAWDWIQSSCLQVGFGVGGVCGVLGVLIFGRRYKERIARLEGQLNILANSADQAELTYKERIHRLEGQIDILTNSFSFENGWNVYQRIMKAKEVDEVEEVFHEFMAQPNRTLEEKVFTVYWLRKGYLLDLDPGDNFERMNSAAWEHSLKTEVDNFMEKVVKEADEIVLLLYPELADEEWNVGEKQ